MRFEITGIRNKTVCNIKRPQTPMVTYLTKYTNFISRLLISLDWFLEWKPAIFHLP